MRVSINDDNYLVKITDFLLKKGVVIITDVIPKKECDFYMHHLVSSFENLGTGISRFNLDTWVDFNLPHKQNLVYFNR